MTCFRGIIRNELSIFELKRFIGQQIYILRADMHTGAFIDERVPVLGGVADGRAACDDRG